MASTTAFEGELWRLRRDDGATICYQLLGPEDAAAPPLLILDGIGCSGWAFRRTLPVLARRQRIIVLHYRGHGSSPDPPRPWRLSMPTLADDAAAVLQHAAIDRVIAVGFSMGFQVALELFRRHRHTVAAMVSLAGPSGRVLRTFQGTRAFAHVLPFVRATTRIARDLTLKAWRSLVPSSLTLDLGLTLQGNADRLAAADFEFYTRQLAEVNPELFMAMLEEADRHSAADVLQGIDVPLMVVAGARDSFVPLETMRELAFAAPHVRWKVLAQATHALPAEFPDEITALLGDFADEVAAELADASDVDAAP
ncbi:MAG: alpha/beta hydrolase [Myxococcales bacterium]|nr:alpha/beta hydrolase [Myxococcales bacterium]